MYVPATLSSLSLLLSSEYLANSMESNVDILDVRTGERMEGRERVRDSLIAHIHVDVYDVYTYNTNGKSYRQELDCTFQSTTPPSLTQITA